MRSKMLLCPACNERHYRELSGHGMCSFCFYNLAPKENHRILCPVCKERCYSPASGHGACCKCSTAISLFLHPHASAEKAQQISERRAAQVNRILQFEKVLLDPHGTLQAVADQLGITRERVRQIINKYPELEHLRSACRVESRQIIKDEIKDEKNRVLAKKAQAKDELATSVVDFALSSHISVNEAVKALGCNPNYVKKGAYHMYRLRTGTKPSHHRTPEAVKKFMQKVIKLLPGLTVSKALRKLCKTTGDLLYYANYCTQLRREDPEFKKLAEEARKLEMKTRGPQQAMNFKTPLPVTEKLRKALRTELLEDHITLAEFSRKHKISAWHTKKIFKSLLPDEKLEDALAFANYRVVAELHKKRKF